MVDLFSSGLFDSKEAEEEDQLTFIWLIKSLALPTAAGVLLFAVAPLTGWEPGATATAIESRNRE